MKKLVIINHLGDIELTLDIYVEGPDFKWESPAPRALWFGRIHLLDLDSYEELLKVRASKPMFIESTEPLTEAEKVAIDEISTYEAAREAYESEVKDATQTVDNQGTGNGGTGEASEPESVTLLPEHNSGTDTPEGNRKPRKRKAT